MDRQDGTRLDIRCPLARNSGKAGTVRIAWYLSIPSRHCHCGKLRNVASASMPCFPNVCWATYCQTGLFPC